VHDRDDVVLREGACEHGLVKKFAGDERAGDKIAMASRKIVVDDRMITGRRQRPAAMRADVARAARNQNGRSIIHTNLVISDRCFARLSTQILPFTNPKAVRGTAILEAFGWTIRSRAAEIPCVISDFAFLHRRP
jgi:hypothetical protein